MKYLEQCIKECLRLYPPIQIIGRQTIKEFTVNNKYLIPFNSTVYVPLVCVHRDPQTFPNPEVFDPKRFSPELRKNRNPYSFIPFSAGPRNCIGQKFALLEEKAILATIFRKYKIQSFVYRNEIKMDISILLRPSNKLKMKFELK
jgi:cytochrome P450